MQNIPPEPPITIISMYDSSQIKFLIILAHPYVCVHARKLLYVLRHVVLERILGVPRINRSPARD